MTGDMTTGHITHILHFIGTLGHILLGITGDGIHLGTTEVGMIRGTTAPGDGMTLGITEDGMQDGIRSGTVTGQDIIRDITRDTGRATTLDITQDITQDIIRLLTTTIITLTSGEDLDTRLVLTGYSQTELHPGRG